MNEDSVVKILKEWILYMEINGEKSADIVNMLKENLKTSTSDKIFTTKLFFDM